MAENSLKKLIDLARIQGNKFFVLDENSEPRLVIMSVEEYEQLLVRKLERQSADIEQINREILEAQKSEDSETAARRRVAQQDLLKSEVIDSTFSFESGDSQEI